ncbi:MAG: helix-turn-helix domain-containing protein [Gammaproteobacteria bacterium]|nr:helix-turn-helix domain-containing protein [Gammaproteobacteria bacterium]
MVKKEQNAKEFARRLKEAAGEAGIYSPRELARLLDVQLQTVKQWYNGSSSPNGKNLTNLLALLRVDSDWLLEGRNSEESVETTAVASNPAEAFRDAIAVINGMGGLLSGRTVDIALADANKIGRTIGKASHNAEQAFQQLAKLYAAKCKSQEKESA